MTAIETAHQRRREMKEAGIDIVRKTPVEKLAEHPNSYKAMVTAMCFVCMGENQGWRKDVKECSSKKCPCYNGRPFQSGDEITEEVVSDEAHCDDA